MHSERKSLRRNNDLAWIGRWNGRNHGGLENASAARWKNGPTRELHHVLQSHPGRRGSLCRRNHRHLFHFQILPWILPEHPRYLRLKFFSKDFLSDIQTDCRYGKWSDFLFCLNLNPIFGSEKQRGSLSRLYPLQEISDGIKGYKVWWVINLL